MPEDESFIIKRIKNRTDMFTISRTGVSKGRRHSHIGSYVCKARNAFLGLRRELLETGAGESISPVLEGTTAICSYLVLFDDALTIVFDELISPEVCVLTM